MNNLQVFKNKQFGEVRTMELNGIVYFVGKDVASVLGYSEPHKAIARHVDEEDGMKHPIPTSSGIQEMYLINESGLYSLILSSKLPQAKEFKRWITSEVLPSIRQTGSYQVQPYQLTRKTYKGVPVMTSMDVSAITSVIPLSSVGYNLRKYKLPYEVLTEVELSTFKAENKLTIRPASSLLIIYKDSVVKLLEIFKVYAGELKTKVEAYFALLPTTPMPPVATKEVQKPKKLYADIIGNTEIMEAIEELRRKAVAFEVMLDEYLKYREPESMQGTINIIRGISADIMVRAHDMTRIEPKLIELKGR